jgi:hypothetical protein
VAEFFGETFETPDRFNMRLFTRFGSLAKRGVDSEDIEGVAMIDALIDQCLRPEDVDRFDELCNRERPDFEELMGFVMEVVAEVTNRPTKRPSDSSDGPTPTTVSSTGDSSSRVIARLEQQERPDLALLVSKAG